MVRVIELNQGVVEGVPKNRLFWLVDLAAGEVSENKLCEVVGGFRPSEEYRPVSLVS